MRENLKAAALGAGIAALVTLYLLAMREEWPRPLPSVPSGPVRNVATQHVCIPAEDGGPPDCFRFKVRRAVTAYPPGWDAGER